MNQLQISTPHHAIKRFLPSNQATRSDNIASSPHMDKEQVVKVFTTDGTYKSFLVRPTQTASAVKFMVSKKLGLDGREFNQFGLYQLENKERE